MDSTINRFATILAGALKTFQLYKQDNKALDEIMMNLSNRFQAVAQIKPVLKLQVTNRSVVYEGDVLGSTDISFFFARTLRTLGFKEIIFKAPIQSRHFFQFLNILSSKESDEIKLEKLLVFVGDDGEKPISLISMTSTSVLLRMPDEALLKQLAPLSVPSAQGGPGFIEALTATPIESMPDLFTWICVKAGTLNKNLASFVRNLTDATREGYFPWERFLKLFPLPAAIKEMGFNKLVGQFTPRPRTASPLGLNFKTRKGPVRRTSVDWKNLMSCYSSEELVARKELLTSGSQQLGLQDLDLAEALLSSTGSDFFLGLRILIRYLGQKNAVVGQEKAVKIGIKVWLSTQLDANDMSQMSLMHALRQLLASPENMTLTLVPLRMLTFESEMFGKISNFILSLGEVALPALIRSLDAEQDRGMRRKLCHVITLIAKQRGVDFLLESIPEASSYLLRNIVMILGDTRNVKSVEALGSLLTHPQQIVQTETIRSLQKINSPEALELLKGQKL